MKSLVLRTTFSFLSAFMALIVGAQDAGGKKVDVNIDVNKGSNSQWYTQPWVWIVAAAVFIILIVALTRNNSRAAE
jgi:hypothetical protein